MTSRRATKPAPGPSPGHLANMRGVGAVDRALAIVEAIERAEGRALGLAELAEATGLYKSTLLRLIVSLERRVLVVKRSDQRYALGAFAFRLGRAFEAQHRVEACVLPVLQELVASGSESPSFHVPHDASHRLCLLRIDSHHSTLDRVRAGDILPMDRGAPGKVIRAFARHGAASRREAPLVQASYGERDPACGAVACPVFGPGSEFAGALSLSGPLERFTPAAVRRMSGPLLAAARRATRALGGTWVGENEVPGRRPPAGRARAAA